MKFILHFSLLLLITLGCQATAAKLYIHPHPTPIVNFLAPIHLTEMHSGLKQIDCIYVINLDHRSERWVRTKKYFNKQGCYPNRVSAVNGWAIENGMRDLLRGPYNLKLNNGAIGCLLSHVSIFKDAYDRQFKTVWICEDDIEFCMDAKEISRIVADLDKIDPDWDVFYTDYVTSKLGTQWTKPRPGQPPFRRGKKEAKGDNIYKVHGRFQTHSMIYSRKGIKKVLDYFTHVYLWFPIDVDIHHVPGIREYSAKNNIVTSIKEGSYSDTENCQLPK